LFRFDEEEGGGGFAWIASAYVLARSYGTEVSKCEYIVGSWTLLLLLSTSFVL
jgi:hypothetical protein